MTRLIICILFFLPLLSYSQERFYNTSNRQDVDHVVSEVLSNTKNTYNQVKIDSLKYPYAIQFHFSDGEHQLFIDFYKIPEAATVILESWIP